MPEYEGRGFQAKRKPGGSPQEWDVEQAEALGQINDMTWLTFRIVLAAGWAGTVEEWKRGDWEEGSAGIQVGFNGGPDEDAYNASGEKWSDLYIYLTDLLLEGLWGVRWREESGIKQRFLVRANECMECLVRARERLEHCQCTLEYWNLGKRWDPLRGGYRIWKRGLNSSL